MLDARTFALRMWYTTESPNSYDINWPRAWKMIASSVKYRKNKAAAIACSCILCWLIMHTIPRKPSVSEVTSEYDCSPLHPQGRQLERRTLYFKGRFRWPTATAAIPPVLANETKQVDTNTSFEMETIMGMVVLEKQDQMNHLRPCPTTVAKFWYRIQRNLWDQSEQGKRLLRKTIGAMRKPRESSGSLAVPTRSSRYNKSQNKHRYRRRTTSVFLY